MLVTRLDPVDECDLLWYFSRGQISFERSTMGSLLERCELFSIAREYRVERLDVIDGHGNVIGHECGISARPTAELRAPSGYVPDDRVLTRFARVSAVLKRVERQSPIASQVFEALFGDLGERWALRSTTYGRLGALFHLTAKGRALLRDDLRKGKGVTSLSTVDRIENIVNEFGRSATAERISTLARCHTQARELERAARQVWLDVQAAA